MPNGVYLSSGSTSGDQFRIILIRMAELYLNLSECYAALDRTDEALENLNVIRERAGVRKLTAADLSIMPLMEWVRNERAIELHAEGHRYYDVRRWRIADQVMQPSEFKGLNGMTVNPSFEDFNQIVPIDQPIQWNVRQYLVPIKIVNCTVILSWCKLLVINLKNELYENELYRNCMYGCSLADSLRRVEI